MCHDWSQPTEGDRDNWASLLRSSTVSLTDCTAKNQRMTGREKKNGSDPASDTQYLPAGTGREMN